MEERSEERRGRKKEIETQAQTVLTLNLDIPLGWDPW
jgi:hypothetical protein